MCIICPPLSFDLSEMSWLAELETNWRAMGALYMRDFFLVFFFSLFLVPRCIDKTATWIVQRSVGRGSGRPSDSQSVGSCGAAVEQIVALAPGRFSQAGEPIVVINRDLETGFCLALPSSHQTAGKL